LVLFFLMYQKNIPLKNLFVVLFENS